MQKGAKFRALAQYMNSCSFVNPNSPRIFIEKYPMPDVKVNCDVSAKKVGKTSYEVDLIVKADALIAVESGSDSAKDCVMEDGKVVAFQCGLSYSGLFEIPGEASSEAANPTLLVSAPNFLFPFVRRIVAGLTIDAGYPPLMLEPIDFEGKFQEQLETKGSESFSSGGAGGSGRVDYDRLDPDKLG